MPNWNRLQLRDSAGQGEETLVYLPGLHGDWTLASRFKAALGGRVRFLDITYPRTVEWTLRDYAGAVLSALEERGTKSGWLLAESFSSQVAWSMIEQTREKQPGTGFEVRGVILAGGFVKYPIPFVVGLAQGVNRRIPMWALQFLCRGYAACARLRHRRAPETLACINQFARYRTEEADRQAILHRYALISGNDPRALAEETRFPVYLLAGFFDPIVPWMFVHPWLKRNCPGYRGWKLIWRAHHNVLSSAPRASAEQVLAWMNRPGPSANPER